MAKIKNLSREPLDFHVAAEFDENGEPVMESVAPGEAKDIAVDVDSPQVKGRRLAGLIAIELPATPEAPATSKKVADGAA